MPSKLHLTERILCITTAFTVPTTQSFQFYSQSFLFLTISLGIPKIWQSEAELCKLESVHGAFVLFHSFSHMAIFIFTYSAGDKQMVIWVSKCFQCSFCCFWPVGIWDFLTEVLKIKEIFRYWPVPMVPVKKSWESWVVVAAEMSRDSWEKQEMLEWIVHEVFHFHPPILLS